MVNYIKTDGKSTVKVNLEVSLIKQGDYIVAYCPALDLSSFGKTEKEAKEGFDGTLETFIEETHKRGTIEKVLLNLGWSLKKVPTVKYRPPIKKQIHNPSLLSSFNERVAIPY